jgi:hypothetical protein
MNEEVDYGKRLKSVTRRTIVSLASYLVFAVGAVTVIVTGQDDYTKYLMIPLVIAVLVLPRFVVPIDFDGRVPIAQKESAEALLTTRKWITWTRFTYLIVALAILFGITELVG